MKKSVNALLSVALLFSMSMTAYANEISSEVRNCKVIAIREDVSCEEAIGDNTYNAEQDNSNIMLLSTENVYWNVWGSHENAAVAGAQGAIPLGYSAHMSGNDVLDTYHYTRTYLGEILKCGDSDRQWGTGTVKATGTFCDDDVWFSHVQYVKYGTTSN